MFRRLLSERLRGLFQHRWGFNMGTTLIQICGQCLNSDRSAGVVTKVRHGVPRRAQRVLFIRRTVRTWRDRRGLRVKICIGLHVQISCWPLHTHTATFTYSLSVCAISLCEWRFSSFIFVLIKCTQRTSHIFLSIRQPPFCKNSSIAILNAAKNRVLIISSQRCSRPLSFGSFIASLMSTAWLLLQPYPWQSIPIQLIDFWSQPC